MKRFVGRVRPSYFHDDTTWVDHFSGANNSLLRRPILHLLWCFLGAALFVILVCYLIATDTKRARWLIFLTDWSLLVQLAFFLIRLPTAYFATKEAAGGLAPHPAASWLVATTRILFAQSLVSSIGSLSSLQILHITITEGWKDREGGIGFGGGGGGG